MFSPTAIELSRQRSTSTASSSTSSNPSTPQSPFVGGQLKIHKQSRPTSLSASPLGGVQQQAVLEFITITLRHDHRSSDLRTLLHDGVIPCRLLKKLYPATDTPLRHLYYARATRHENLEYFLTFCQTTGILPEYDAVYDLNNLDETYKLVAKMCNQLRVLHTSVAHKSTDRAGATDKNSTGSPLSELPPVGTFQSRRKSRLTATRPSTLQDSAKSQVSIQGNEQEEVELASWSTSLVSRRSTLKAERVQLLPYKPRQEVSKAPPSPVRECITLPDGPSYLLGNVIGKGQFGTVHRALDTSTGCVVAIKRIPRTAHSPEDSDCLMHEVDLLRDLSAPSIVQYHGFVMDSKHLNIVEEYVENGSLLHSIKTFGCFNEKLAAAYTSKILDGLIYLHKRSVIHCDLKCANVLTTKCGQVKLSDFGVSLNTAGNSTIKGEVNGTPNWLAPEIITLRGTCKASDIWALGCTVLEMIQGKPPYDSQVTMAAMYSIVEDEHPPLPSRISDELRFFLLACFRKEPRERPTAEDLRAYAWLVSGPAFQSDLVPAGLALAFGSEKVGVINGEGKSRNKPEEQILEMQETPVPAKKHVLVKSSFRDSVSCSRCDLKTKKAFYCQDCSEIMHLKCSLGTSCLKRPEKAVKSTNDSVPIAKPVSKTRRKTCRETIATSRIQEKGTRPVTTDCTIM